MRASRIPHPASRFALLITCYSLLIAPLFAGPLEDAENAFNKKNYKDARVAYEKFVAGPEAKKHDKYRHAVNQVIACRLRMGEHADALTFAKSRIEADKDTVWEGRSHRRYANLLMAAPHWGMRRAGEFHRGKRGQGEYVRSFRKDRTEAIKHFEAARTIYQATLADKNKLAELPKDQQDKFLPEALECNFDLAGSLLRRGENTQSWDWWDSFGEETEEFEEYEPGYGYRRRGVRGSNPPSGLRVDKKGNPIFTVEPKSYKAALPDDQRVRFLLKEIEAKDPTPNNDMKALAIYRRAMVARARFGPDIVTRWWQQGHRRFGRLGEPLENDPAKPEKELWHLKENEALTWVAGQLKVITLPPKENIVTLLEEVAHEYSKSSTADDALYALGAFFQTRQQYPRSLEAYETLLGKFPQTTYRNQATNARQQIVQKEIQLHQIGAQLAGEKARLQISYRNTGKVTFTIQPIDLPGYIARIPELNGKTVPRHPKVDINGIMGNAQNMIRRWQLSSYLLDQRFNRYRKWLKGAPKSWTVDVKNDGTMRPAQTVIDSPIHEGGTYFVEARVAGARLPSRSMFIVSSIAILEKNIPNKRLYYLADAISGAPVNNAPFSIYEVWVESRRAGNKWQQINHVVKHEAKSDKAGLFELSLPPIRQRRSRNLFAVAHIPEAGQPVDAPKARFAYTDMGYWSPQNPTWRRDNNARIFTLTDRPVYRPEDTVNFKIWIRKKQNGEYITSAGQNLHVEIFDAKNNKILTKDWKADKNGSAAGKLVLGEEPPLGRYRMQVRSKEGGRWRWYGNAQFRVEEYKKPEFEVSVKPGKDNAKLGESLTANIEAKYYFGAPVTEATVKYKVFRQAFAHNYVPRGRYDWLYGQGYGIIDYPYQWMPWWKRWGCCRIAPPWYQWRPAAARQLVKHGEAQIDNGKLEITIDTKAAAENHGDSDHRYFIEAEVTDSSRRTITGSGSVSATRQSFYAYVSTDHGWLKPDDQATFTIKTVTPDEVPVATKGKLTIASVKYKGRTNDEVVEEVHQSFDIETGANGLAELPIRIGRSGQFRVSYKTKDPWGGEVQGNAMVWVAGDDFDGQHYRFNELEVLTDKREYKIGDTAHVMLNVSDTESYVLFSPDAYQGTMRKYQLLYLPKRSVVIDIPVQKRHEPNFHIEATVIRNGKVSSMMRELAVPTKRHFLEIKVTPDKPSYSPGDSGNLMVEVTDHTGEPVQTELAVAAFDRSVLYIQPETTPKIEQLFYGQKRYHRNNTQSSLQMAFNAQGGGVRNPFRASGAKDWNGYWGPAGVYWAQATGQQIAGFGGGGGYASLKRKSARSMSAANGIAMDAEVAAAPGAPAAKMANRRGRANAAGAVMEKQMDRADADKKGNAALGDTMAEAKVRTNFADTALWAASVPTSAEGKASIPITFPESLTSWKINAWGVSAKTQVGYTSASTITTKNLMVRLQSPRFYVERDEVILSAIVNNYLKTEKKVKVELGLSKNGTLATIQPSAIKPLTITVPAGGEKRVDWKVIATKEGLAEITVKALTNEESDAMKMAFPVFVHGVRKQLANVGSIAPDKELGRYEYKFTLPAAMKPEATRVTVKIAPSLAGAVLDALPYLFDYEYDTVEATLSRFLPAIVAKRMLVDTGLNLEALQEKRKDLLTSTPEYKKGYWRNPVFNTAKLDNIVKTCMKRIMNWQQGNGGWGWWGSSRASVYQTCYVLYSLNIAQQAGIQVDPKVMARAASYILNNLEHDYGKFEWNDKESKTHYSFGTGHAYACYVASLSGSKDPRMNKWLDIMFTHRDRLNNYGKALLCLTYHKSGNLGKATTLLQNIEQYLKQDDEVQLAWLDTPSKGWWRWFNNDVETNAWFLQCYNALKPKDEKPRRLVKWLLTNRRHGHYWHSTRDTALTVNAFAQYLKASGELAPDYELEVAIDNGALGKKTFKVNSKNMFFFDNIFEISGEEVGPGDHTISIIKRGKGAAYISSITSFFTKEEDIKGAGLELRVTRNYFKLVPKVKSVDVTTTSGSKVAEKFAKMERVALKNGDELTSGDQLEVELMLEAKNDYDYLVFEDMKPAGCEPLDVRSGSSRQEGLVANMELRDEKVVFFIQMLHQGKHRLRYRMRAEVPGHFHALPTKGYGMYAPDLYGTADEMRVQIKDK